MQSGDTQSCQRRSAASLFTFKVDRWAAEQRLQLNKWPAKAQHCKSAECQGGQEEEGRLCIDFSYITILRAFCLCFSLLNMCLYVHLQIFIFKFELCSVYKSAFESTRVRAEQKWTSCGLLGVQTSHTVYDYPQFIAISMWHCSVSNCRKKHDCVK